jgi:hypothetical protein
MSKSKMVICNRADGCKRTGCLHIKKHSEMYMCVNAKCSKHTFAVGTIEVKCVEVKRARNQD